MTQQERIERMDQIDIQVADLRNEYITLKDELIEVARSEELENAPVRAEVQTLEMTGAELATHRTHDVSYQAMREWLDDNVSAQSPETPGETREAIKATALHASRSLNDGWWPTNGLSATVQSDMRDAMYNHSEQREGILKSMRLAVREWSHEHNQELKAKDESLRESLDQSLSAIRQEQREMRVDTGIRMEI